LATTSSAVRTGSDDLDGNRNGTAPSLELAALVAAQRVQHATAAPDTGTHAARGQDARHQASQARRGGLLTASAAQRLAKRLLDIVAGTAALILLLPLLLVAAAGVASTSRGPVFYVDWRAGRNGRPFRMWKFRSMHVDADRRLAELLEHNEVTGPVFKMRRDPRITRVGRILRKLSIDEMPQLINVIKGDMSLVGPRPPLPAECARYSARQHERLAVKPGLTCIWQVSGRSDIAFDDWVAMDLEYIARWSFGLDLQLLIRTIPAVLSGRGAY
jgi:lipopolysaccharide/colanic/teichoic acid biosynthesis glycosyltransferase